MTLLRLYTPISIHFLLNRCQRDVWENAKHEQKQERAPSRENRPLGCGPLWEQESKTSEHHETRPVAETRPGVPTATVAHAWKSRRLPSSHLGLFVNQFGSNHYFTRKWCKNWVPVGEPGKRGFTNLGVCLSIFNEKFKNGKFHYRTIFLIDFVQWLEDITSTKIENHRCSRFPGLVKCSTPIFLPSWAYLSEANKAVTFQ